MLTLNGSYECHVQNLSLRGVMIKFDRAVAVSEAVTLMLAPSTEISGFVKWQRNGSVGIRIKEQRTSETHFGLPFGWDCSLGPATPRAQ